MTQEDQTTLQRLKSLKVEVYRGLHLNTGNMDARIVDQWIEQASYSPVDLEKLLNHIHIFDFFSDIQDEMELQRLAEEIAYS